MVRDLIRGAKDNLAKAGYSEVDAEILFAHLLGINRMELHNPVALEKAMENIGDIAEDYHQLVNRRLSHEPLQYITGEAHFRDLTLEVGPGVLVPRPESELMVSYLLALIEQKEGLVSVIDLGAGSGALSIALSTECDRVRAIAVEKSPEALLWLRKNVARYVEEMRVVEGDVKNALPDVKADFVIANPPYVPDDQELPADVKNEPSEALFGGATGLEIPKVFIEAATRLLKPGGVLAIEHTELQGQGISGLLEEMFTKIELHYDLNDRPRWTSAVRK
ncbi:MAG: peptide chain release factor N(5)-glutamine methyltransferase [Candidatus Nanopelagicaceae bacterium]